MNKLDRSCLMIGDWRHFLLGVISGVIVILLTGCSGGRLYVGYEAVDEMQITQKLARNGWTWRCLFTECEGTKEG